MKEKQKKENQNEEKKKKKRYGVRRRKKGRIRKRIIINQRDKIKNMRKRKERSTPMSGTGTSRHQGNIMGMNKISKGLTTSRTNTRACGTPRRCRIRERRDDRVTRREKMSRN